MIASISSYILSVSIILVREKLSEIKKFNC